MELEVDPSFVQMANFYKIIINFSILPVCIRIKTHVRDGPEIGFSNQKFTLKVSIFEEVQFEDDIKTDIEKRKFI